ncbi:MAG TPA: DUF3618 domain-containing protein [Dermatophilaceae bacterium]
MAKQNTTSQDVNNAGVSPDDVKADASRTATRIDHLPDGTKANLTPDEIEAEIATTREHLASTIDELAVRAQPREIVRRQTESARSAFVEATHTPEGDLRVERIGAIAAAASAVLLVLALLHRRHHRG